MGVGRGILRGGRAARRAQSRLEGIDPALLTDGVFSFRFSVPTAGLGRRLRSSFERAGYTAGAVHGSRPRVLTVEAVVDPISGEALVATSRRLRLMALRYGGRCFGWDPGTEEEFAARLRQARERAADGLVWSEPLAGRCHFEVRREPSAATARQAQLTVLDGDGQVLLREPVGLSYGARFGAHVTDVLEWRERARRVVPGEPD